MSQSKKHRWSYAEAVVIAEAAKAAVEFPKNRDVIIATAANGLGIDESKVSWAVRAGENVIKGKPGKPRASKALVALLA